LISLFYIYIYIYIMYFSHAKGHIAFFNLFLSGAIWNVITEK